MGLRRELASVIDESLKSKENRDTVEKQRARLLKGKRTRDFFFFLAW
jgi:hypothetical protein